jgi:hypothetical protein
VKITFHHNNYHTPVKTLERYSSDYLQRPVSYQLLEPVLPTTLNEKHHAAVIFGGYA